MVAKLKNDYGFSLEESQRAKLMKLAGDLGKVDSSYIAAIHNDQSVLFSFENHSYTVADFASFLSKGRDVTVNAPDYISTMIGYMADMEIFFCHRPNTTSCRQSTLTGWNGSSRK